MNDAEINELIEELRDAATTSDSPDWVAAMSDRAVRVFEQMKAENSNLRELLTDLQWSGSMWSSGSCLFCSQWQENGHSESCKIGKALGVAK